MACAEYFLNWDSDRLNHLQVLAPYEGKDKLKQWVYGNIRNLPPNDDVYRDFVVTGPRMKICYGGCNWNRIVFAMNGAANPPVYHFEQWLRQLSERVKASIWSDPAKYKNGATTNSRFVFDDDYIRPASDPAMYPDELRCRLSVKRIPSEDGSGYKELPDADLFIRKEDGDFPVQDLTEIRSGWYMIPVLKFSYYRNGERFGLVITVLRGMIFPTEISRIDNKDWQMDYPTDMIIIN